MYPVDHASLATIAVTAGCLAAAWRARQTRVRLLLILAAALLIRVDPAWQISLHPWDEQFHAVVATNLIAHPLTPTLYEHPLADPPPVDWTMAHVWLHKPPLSMWLMALSMGALGVDALAMRLPSLLLSGAGVLLTFLVGRRLFGERVGLLAAGFQAVNGLLVGLASGRRVADHVDSLLVTCVQLGVFFLFRERQPARPALGAALVGAATGAGLLAKSFPALVIPAVAAIWWLQTLPLRAAARRLAWLAASAAIVAGPWILYSHLAFPREATSATAYTLRHLTEVVEGHGGPWWMYVEQMPRFFGDLIYVPVIWFAAGALRRGAAPADRALLAWMAVPYVVFSVLATKLPAFIAIAAPALFLAQAACWDALRRQAIRNSVLRASRVVLLLLLLVLPARHLLEPSGPFEARDRHAPATARLMRLDATVGLADAVIFNLPRDVEAMFYSRYDVYSRWPRLEEAAALNERGTTIVIFSPAGEAPPVVPEHWNARILRESDLDRALAVPRPE